MNLKKKKNYEIAREGILKLIADNAIQEGEILPALNTLTDYLNVGRISVQNAIRKLCEEGILKTRPGSGTYVENLSLLAPAKPASLYNELAPAFKRKKIRFGVLREMPAFTNFYQTIVKQYMAGQFDVEIELVPLQCYNDLAEMAAANELDGFQVSPAILATMVDKGYLFNPEKVDGFTDLADTFFASVWESTRYQNINWGTPMSVSVPCEFYHPEYEPLFAEADAAGDFLAKLAAIQRAMPPFISDKTIAACAYCQQIFTLMIQQNQNRLELGHINDFLNRDQGLDKLRQFETFLQDRRLFLPRVENVTRLFMARKTMMVMMATASINGLKKDLNQDLIVKNRLKGFWGINNLHVNINVIAANTFFPEEVRDFVRYLGSVPAQQQLADIGVPVANKKAYEQLNLPFVNDDAVEEIRRAIINSRAMSSNEVCFDNYVQDIVYPELFQWQTGKYNLDTFCRTLQRKTNFYLQAFHAIQK